MRLNLGSSDDLKAGYLNVDCCEPPRGSTINNFLRADLSKLWPWSDSSIDEIYAHDVFEHLNQIWAMNEAHRVLKPGGHLDLAVPSVALPDGRVNPGAFCDPTHISWWSLDTRFYFCQPWNNPQGERGRLGPAYGITALFKGDWSLHEYGTGPEVRSKIMAILQAIK